MSGVLIDPNPRTFGDGLTVGPIGFGCWRFTQTDNAAAHAVLDTAVDLGMNLVDTADVYGLDWGGTGFGTVEERLGEVLASAPGLRDRIVLATKGGIVPGVPYDSSATALRSACEASLRRLRVDCIDLYQVHRPDLFTHPSEVATTLAALHREGKIRSVGTSNHTPAQHQALASALTEVGIRVATTQVEWSAQRLDPMRNGTFDLAMEEATTVLGWSPLAGGRLTEGVDPSGDQALVDVLDDLADRHGVTRSTIGLAYALTPPCRPVILVGTQTPQRLRAATEALGVPLTRTDAYRIIEASEGVPLP